MPWDTSALPLKSVDYAILLLTYTGLLAGGAALAGSIRDHFTAVSRRGWYILFGLMALHLFVLQPLITHAPWQPNHHGIECWADVRDGNGSSAQLTDNHGWGYFIALFGPYRYLFFEQVPVLWIASILSTVTLLIVFLFTFGFLESQVAALGTVAILVLLPVRMRISATETMSTPLELFLAAELLLFQLYIQHRRAAYFVLALAALLLAMETRLEALAFAPLIGLMLFLASPHAIVAVFKRPATLIPLLIFPLLTLPHLSAQFAIEQHRLSQVGSAVTNAAEPFEGVHFNSFFNPTYSPRLFLVPLIIGAIVLARRSWVKLLILTLMWLPMSRAYMPYYGDVSTYVRCNANTQLALAMICGVGIHALFTWRTRRGFVGRLAWAVLVLLPLGPLECLEFLRYRTAEQQEFALLARANAALPANAGVAMLTVRDREPRFSALGGDSAYQYAYFRRPAGPGARDFYSLSSLLGRPSADVTGLYYYQGTPCYRRLPCPTCAVERDPLCTSLTTRYRLEPVAVETIQPTSLDGMPDPDLGDPAELGLYRLAPLQPGANASPGEAALTPADLGGNVGGPNDELPWHHPSRTSAVLFPVAFFLVPLWRGARLMVRRRHRQV